MGLYDYIRCDVYSWTYHLFKPMNEKNFAVIKTTIKKYANEKNFATIKKYAMATGKAILILFVLFVTIMNFGSLDNARMKR